MKSLQNKPISEKDTQDPTRNEADLRDRLGKLLFERACEIIHDPESLSKVLQSLPANTGRITSLSKSRQGLAELILADDAENVGRLVIDQVVNIAWVMAEHELGFSVSENPDSTALSINNTH